MQTHTVQGGLKKLNVSRSNENPLQTSHVSEEKLIKYQEFSLVSLNLFPSEPLSMKSK